MGFLKVKISLIGKKRKWKKRADFRALVEKNPSWKEKITSQTKLKIVQLEPWLEPARLGLITNNYNSV